MVKYLINMTPRYYDILMLDIPEEEMIKIMEGEIDNGEEEAIRTI
jgi:hypothetical protein